MFCTDYYVLLCALCPDVWFENHFSTIVFSLWKVNLDLGEQIVSYQILAWINWWSLWECLLKRMWGCIWTRGKKIGAPLVMPATGTGIGIVDILPFIYTPSPRSVPPGEEKKLVSILLGFWAPLGMTKVLERGQAGLISPACSKRQCWWHKRWSHNII